MKNIRSQNAKEYWQILNNGRRRKQPNISLAKLFEFYKELNAAPSDDDNGVYLPPLNEDRVNQLNHNLNLFIEKEEILHCIKKLKNNKASGEDAIINEYIKATSTQFIEIYEKLFNLIFDTGYIPENWLIGNIIPVYKNKGDSDNPKNFRPITIVSCLGKLFTAILSERLNKYSDDFLVLQENQCGFRHGYSTIDNLFVLYSFFEILKRKKKKMYCAFIDFEKAFDKIWREGLWYKLLLNNINGKMFYVIRNMYKNIKSNIIYNGDKSDYFPCDNGVRQGEN